jgi:endo-1,4-beta-xylanase
MARMCVSRFVVTALATVVAAAMLSGCLGGEAAKSGRLFGSWVDTFYGNLNNPKYSDTLGQFSMLEIYNDWNMVEPTQGHFDYSYPDKWFNYVASRGATVKSSALVWAHNTPQHSPEYLYWPITVAQLRDELRSHLQTYVGHYPQVKVWNVVNEPVDGTGAWRDNVFGQRLGSDWIREALVDAYQANPNATFVAINDFGADGMNAKSDKIFQYYRDHLVGAIPSDHLAVGLQMHLSACDAGLDNPSPDKIKQNIQRFADLGVQVHITEMSYNVRCLPAATRFQSQANKYHDVVAACMAVAQCRAISTWGVGDTDSRSEAQATGGTPDYPMLYDQNYTPKPAYYSVVDALNGR